jgi:hypothetical protein
MPDKHSEKLHRIDPPAVALLGGNHYREIAGQLRELARRCRFRTGRGELVQLAATFEYRADRFDSRWR